MKKVVILLFTIAITVGLWGQSVQEQILSLVPRDSAVYRHGYMELKSADQQLYDTILGSILRFDANNYSPYYYHKCALMGVDNTRNIQVLAKDIKRMSNDIPELYILSSTIAMYDYTNYYYYARIGYQNKPDTYLNDLKAMRTAFDSCSTGITAGMSDYAKIKILHDNYCRWFNYGDMTGAAAGTAKGALINRRAVCQGIAYGWLYLCQQAGLKCIYVSGRQGVVNHSWNYIQVDGQWYMIDLTADGGLVGVDVGYAAFLKGSEYMNNHYSLLDRDGNDPNCNGVYSSLPTLAEDDYNPNQVPSHIEQTTASPTEHSTKRLLNGQIVIHHNDKAYTVIGQPICQ